MTPKEKALDLVDRYYWTFGDGYLGEQHIQCALIAVDEIIDSEPQYEWSNDYWKNPNDFWQEVKKEIEKL